MSVEKPLVVRAVWDEEARVWVASSNDVPGLATEAVTVDALVEELKVMIPELLDANGCADGDEFHFQVCSEYKGVAYRLAA